MLNPWQRMFVCGDVGDGWDGMCHHGRGGADADDDDDGAGDAPYTFPLNVLNQTEADENCGQ